MTDADTFFADETDWSALKRRTLSGSMFTGIGQVVRIAVNFVTQIVLTRLLLPEQFGLVAMVLPIVAFIELFGNLGLANAVIQRDRISSADLNALYWFGLLASGILAGVLVLLSPVLAWMYGDPRVMPIAIALATLLPIAAIAGHASALMARQMKFGALAVIDVFAAVGALAAVIVAAWFHAGYWAVVAGQIVGTGMRAAFDLLLSGWRPSRPRWVSSALPMLRFGGQISLFNIISYLSGYVDNILVGIFMGPGPLGLFDRSFALVLRPLGSITAPIGKVAVPLLSRCREDEGQYRAAFLTLAQALLLLLVPGLVAASVLARDVVLWMLGEHWIGVVPMFAAISVAAMFVPLSGASYWIFVSQDRAGEQVRAALWSSGSVIVAMLVALPWGAVGIAIGYAIIAPFVHGIYAWQAGRTGPVVRWDFVRLTAPVVVGAGIGALLVAGFATLPVDAHWMRLASGLAIAYLGMIAGFALFPTGRASLRQGVALTVRTTAVLRDHWRARAAC